MLDSADLRLGFRMRGEAVSDQQVWCIFGGVTRLDPSKATDATKSRLCMAAINYHQNDCDWNEVPI